MNKKGGDNVIEIKAYRDGELVAESDFEGVVGVGFRVMNEEEDVLNRLLNRPSDASFVLGELSAEDLVNALVGVQIAVEESLNELGCSLDDFDIDIERGE